MNLVQTANWIQEAYKEVYSRPPIPRREVTREVVSLVMRKSRGGLNPKTVQYLAELETSIPDWGGTTQCSAL